MQNNMQIYARKCKIRQNIIKKYLYFEFHLMKITRFFNFYFQSVLSASHIKQKPKVLRKAIQSGFKKYSQLTDRECCFKFLEILKSVYRFDQERFRCALGVRYIIVLYINIYTINMILIRLIC